MPQVAAIDYEKRYAGTPIKIACSEIVGRYFVSNRAISKGEVILESGPQVFISSEEHESRVCDNCFHTKDGATLPFSCPGCHRVHFCSERCRDDAADRHSLECRVLSGLDWSKYDEYTKDIVRLFIRTLATRELDNERGSAQMAMIMELASNTEQFPQDQREALKALLEDLEKVVEAARNAGHAVVALPSRDEMSEVYCREYINSFGLWRSAGQGLGVYVISSLINHSCAPNVVRFENGPRVIFRAAVDIPADTELNIAYIPIEDSVTVRRRWLEDGFHFRCMCPRCQADDEAIAAGREVDDSLIDYLTGDDCPLGCGGKLVQEPKPYATTNKFCSGCGLEKIRASLFARPN